MTGFRLDARGAVDRSESRVFRFNGKVMRGFAGDTLASGLLANGVRLVGRGFKYHRPRGVMSAGEEEGGALVTTGRGARRTPNLKAPRVELEDGLVVESQNHWPNLKYDVGEVNDLLGRFFAAGFYYKTFFGLTGSPREWLLYERVIRQAAGLGRATTRPDPDWSEVVHGHCDVLVVGSGAAGLAAAVEAAKAGLDVVLVEQDFELGGDLLTGGVMDEHTAEWWRVEQVSALRSATNVRVMPRTLAFGLFDHDTVGMLERVPAPRDDASPRERMHVLRFRRLIVAAGAVERPVAFGDNDRPGVMLADAVRVYVDRFAVAPGRKVVIATNNDGGYRAARACAEVGLRTTLIDARHAPPPRAKAEAETAGAEVRAGLVPVQGLGRDLRGVLVGRHEGGGRATPTQRIECDVLGVSGGWSPAIQLTSHARARPVWDAQNACFLAGDAGPSVLVAGAAAGVWGRHAAMASGRAAGREAARDLGASEARALSMPPAGGWEAPIEPLWEVTVRDRKLKSFVDPIHDVTTADIRLAHQEGFESVEHMKRYTTLGMATDQGRMGNVMGLAIMAQARGIATEAQGTTTFRPPAAPISVGAVAGAHTGAHWSPVRRTPFHARAEAAGAVFTDAGLWKRTWFFPAQGEDLTKASMREAAMVRATVGMVDVSTLGKIMVQGPDAGEFLDRIYCNRMSTLKIGRARYGLMLREDGVVKDDGTVWRLSDGDWMVTCTTGGAGDVMRHVEAWAHRWPELRVAIASVSDAWGGLAVAGPRAREALARITSADVSAEGLPFMGVRPVQAAGIPGCWIARISFSGELGYEVYAPADRAEPLWDALAEACEGLGGGHYGLEALDILRVEKGHVTGRELDGRTTAADLGLGRMVSRKKSAIGTALCDLGERGDANRPRLVGLTPVDPKARVQAGALLFPSGEREGFGLGHVSSIADSPHLGARIALGFVRGGLESWDGRRVVARDPTGPRNGAPGEVVMTVSSPHFIDPAGERLHG